MTVLTDSFGLVRFGGEVIMEDKSVIEEAEVMQKTVIDEKESWEGGEKEFAQLRSSVAESD